MIMKRFYHILVGLALVSAVGCSCSKAETDEDNSAPFVKVNISEQYVNNKSGSFEVYVQSNTSWKVESKVDWITVSTAEGSGNRNITIKYEDNFADDAEETYGENRQGTVRITAEGTMPATITVKQGLQTFKNPVFMPMPDPYIWREETANGAVYYPCKSGGRSVNLGKTNKLTDWGGTSVVWNCPEFNEFDLDNTWNSSNLWAPELHRINGVWYVYYAAGWPSDYSKKNGHGDYGTQRTGVLRNTNEDPTTGIWGDMGQIFTGDADDLEQYKADGNKATTLANDYAIDMTPFELDGKLYAIWSGNDENGRQRLYIAPMVNPYTIETARVLLASPEYAWEKETSDLLEGPAMLFNPDKTKLFCVYSCCQSTTYAYKLGWLELDLKNSSANDPLNPANWKKSPQPVFSRCDNFSKHDNPNYEDAKNESTMSFGGVNGVGHNTFTKSPDGTEDWIVYHTKRYVESGWDNRDAFIQKFTWNEEGYPVFGTPVGWQEPLEVPSGEPL